MTRPIRRKQGGEYHHGDLRRALIDAALELVDEAGPAAVSTRALARRLGVSHAAPAHHFADKEALLAAVATEGFEMFTADLEAAAARPGTPRRRLAAVGGAYIQFAADHPSRFRVMFGRGDPGGPPPLEASMAEALRSLGVLEGAVAALLCVEREHPAVRALSFTAWSLVHGLAMLWIDGAARALFSTREAFEAAAAGALEGAIDDLRPARLVKPRSGHRLRPPSVR